jgi:hypothetical protein
MTHTAGDKDDLAQIRRWLRMRPMVLVAVLVLAAAALVGVVLALSGGKQTLHGEADFEVPAGSGVNSTCSEYQTRLNVEDGAGKVLAAVHVVDHDGGPAQDGTASKLCAGTFTVKIPKESVYILRRTDSSSAAVTINASEIKKGRLPTILLSR